jgi:hypothetical protein
VIELVEIACLGDCGGLDRLDHRRAGVFGTLPLIELVEITYLGDCGGLDGLDQRKPVTGQVSTCYSTGGAQRCGG